MESHTGKTKTKVITLANHNTNKQQNEPISTPSRYKFGRQAREKF